MSMQKLAKQLDKLIKKAIKEEEKNPTPKPEKIYASLIFTEEECKQMGVMVGAELLSVGRAVRCTKERRKDSFLYTLQYYSNRYNIVAEDSDLGECKRKFIRKTLEIPIPEDFWSLIEEITGKQLKMSA